MHIEFQEQFKLAIIGLGYVGCPLAVEFGKTRNVIGFDINQTRLQELKQCHDKTGEVDSSDLVDAKGLVLTDRPDDLKGCNCFIITVPTPIDEQKKPDLSFIEQATQLVASVLKIGDFVVYESTVFPGLTEGFCGPLLEKASGIKQCHTSSQNGFFLGYSPERINPGDKTHRLRDIIKITSGSTPEAAKLIDDLYSTIIEAGTYRAENIQIAEAAKVIENTQRDINIAFMNELSMLFNKMDIDTKKVIKAASTKWNFLPFEPGLVGGHCIGVDPYYLIHKAKDTGHVPTLISCAREINDKMPKNVANEIVLATRSANLVPADSDVLILGVTFKPNCPDVRNSKVFDLASHLKQEFKNLHLHDPMISQDEMPDYLNHTFEPDPVNNNYDVVVLAVPHDFFVDVGFENIKRYAKQEHVFFDLHSVFEFSDSAYSL